jgi:hypothetical protein
MGIYSGPLKPVDGLVYHIDPANTKSYPGTGLTFYDLVTGGIGGTLTNGPTYDVASKGGFYFDGIDDYAICGRREDIQGTNITLSVWARFYSLTSGDVAVCFGWTDGVNWRNGNGIGSYGGYIRSFLTSLFYTGNLNDWYHVAIASSGGTNNLYINGIGVSSTSTSFTYASTNLLLMGWGGSGYGSYGKFTLGSAKIYNRGLTASEVSQEYNATKKRYLPEENIVRNGLVLNIDPAKYSSYPGSGTTIYDVSGNGNTGTLTNGPTFLGLNGGSIVFDGSNDYVTIGDKLDLGLDSYTFSCWFKLNSVSGYQCIFSKSIADYATNRYALYIDNNKLKSFMQGDLTSGDVDFPSALTLTTNTWFHITSVYDRSGTLKLYVNGVLDTSQAISQWQNVNIQTSYTFKIGAYASPGDAPTFFTNGNITSFLAYNRALSALEVMQNYNATKSRYNI